MNKAFTCCFTGHRKLPQAQTKRIVERLGQEVDRMIDLGVTNFLSGGALGFDHMAAGVILSRRKAGRAVRLILALPCRHQERYWSIAQQSRYHIMLAAADQLVYVSEEYHSGCMEKRNRYMVDRSSHCICALSHLRSGTGQTVRYAREQGVETINVLD